MKEGLEYRIQSDKSPSCTDCSHSCNKPGAPHVTRKSISLRCHGSYSTVGISDVVYNPQPSGSHRPGTCDGPFLGFLYRNVFASGRFNKHESFRRPGISLHPQSHGNARNEADTTYPSYSPYKANYASHCAYWPALSCGERRPKPPYLAPYCTRNLPILRTLALT